MSEGVDLSTVTNEEMLAELQRRHETAVVILERRETPGRNGTRFHYSGGLSTVIGLVSRMRVRLLQEADEADVNEEV